MMKKHLLSCDWGTSSFRLRLVNVADRDVVGEVTTPNGVGAVYNAWQEEHAATGVPRGQYYRSVISTQIAALSRQTGLDTGGNAHRAFRYGLVVDRYAGTALCPLALFRGRKPSGNGAL
ncbi:hypothetical protein [Dyadobacter sp. 676]|uniref:2-dehydro-3-deoxygalactonokinase n=1 Tax=Dyadobacter sp. 676 TaxID=3088362 RepID=A0AAU8FK58_9BACT